jgi:hypothetical protein
VLSIHTFQSTSLEFIFDTTGNETNFLQENRKKTKKQWKTIPGEKTGKKRWKENIGISNGCQDHSQPPQSGWLDELAANRFSPRLSFRMHLLKHLEPMKA